MGEGRTATRLPGGASDRAPAPENSWCRRRPFLPPRLSPPPHGHDASSRVCGVRPPAWLLPAALAPPLSAASLAAARRFSVISGRQSAGSRLRMPPRQAGPERIGSSVAARIRTISAVSITASAALAPCRDRARSGRAVELRELLPEQPVGDLPVVPAPALPVNGGWNMHRCGGPRVGGACGPTGSSGVIRKVVGAAHGQARPEHGCGARASGDRVRRVPGLLAKMVQELSSSLARRRRRGIWHKC